MEAFEGELGQRQGGGVVDDDQVGANWVQGGLEMVVDCEPRSSVDEGQGVLRLLKEQSSVEKGVFAKSLDHTFVVVFVNMQW